jgi:tRNA A37 threonylcarbamoyladenosine modification protein TsaB
MLEEAVGRDLSLKLTAMMDEVRSLQPEDIDQIVISEGPGSYTPVCALR